jgi:hypothetical protein
VQENVKVGLREIGFQGLDWVQLAQDGRQWQVIAHTVENIRNS